MYDFYKNIEEYSPNKKHEILIVFDEMNADTDNNKKLNKIVTEFLIRGIKSIISLFYITQSYFKIPKCVRLNTTHFLFFNENSK